MLSKSVMAALTPYLIVPGFNIYSFLHEKLNSSRIILAIVIKPILFIMDIPPGPVNKIVADIAVIKELVIIVDCLSSCIRNVFDVH